MTYEDQEIVREKLSSFVITQDKLNTHTCGKDWEKGICKKTGKKIDFIKAILVETGEMFESDEYKHWKAMKRDCQNIRMELVDILHFLISELIVNYGRDGLVNLIQDGLSLNLDYLPKNTDTKIVMNLLTELDNLKYNTSDSQILYIINLFFQLVTVILKPEKPIKEILDVLDLYEKKTLLNLLRQNNGYVEGTYIKDWNGEEDNKVVERLLAGTTLLTEEAYRLIDDYYKKEIKK